MIKMHNRESLEQLMNHMGYRFNDRYYLQLALTHRSKHQMHNERLEFLGDSILGAIIAEALYERFPNAKEGQLSKCKVYLVKGMTLTNLARDFDLGSYLAMGTGEKHAGGHKRERLLEDTLEAVIGAIFLDSDYVGVRSVVLKWYENYFEQLMLEGTPKDSKTTLQEYCHQHGLNLPVYQLEKVSGKDHESEFHVRVRIPAIQKEISASASSKKKAEQKCATEILMYLKKTYNES
jgi:ribonuclease-3